MCTIIVISDFWFYINLWFSNLSLMVFLNIGINLTKLMSYAIIIKRLRMTRDNVNIVIFNHHFQ